MVACVGVVPWPASSNSSPVKKWSPAPDAGRVGPLIRQLLLDRIEQGAVNDRWLLAGQDLTLISDLADIEPVAQEIEQRSPLEWDATADAASCKQPWCGCCVP